MDTAITRHDEQPIGTGRDAAPARRRRSPAVPVAAAFALGILADHLFEPDLRVWLVALAICLACWGACAFWRVAGASAVLLLAAVLIAGAGWHHWRWSIVEANHIVCFAEE